jgi:predicted CXXCH cytochrome family protein
MPTPSRALRTKKAMRSSLGAICLLLFVAPFIPRIAQSQATPVREADAQCAGCHAEIYRKYLTTPMANASGLATENLRTATFLHPPSGVEYKISTVNGKALLASRSPNGSEGFTLTYFLGSGHLGTTYLYSIGNYLFESPVAWYAASNSYDMKPGLADIAQAPPPLPMQSSCMRCHMSSVRNPDPGTINRYEGLPFLHSGITCEACHGDSREHVLTQSKGTIVNPSKLDAGRRDSVCISCHLEGDVSIERAGHNALDYRPGDLISSYVAYYVKSGGDLTARGVSEVEQLSQSTCKRVSGERMSCTSCHDPHYTPDAEHRTAFYRNKCLSCHSQPEFATAHHPENQDCTSCHMPAAGAANILHVAWTDHRILKIPEAPKTEAPRTGERTLVPIFSPGASDRDLGMAYYQSLLLEGDRLFESAAWELLKQQQATISNDKDALDALGNLGAERGDSQTAESAFSRVLELDPRDLTALSNLAILRAKEGKLKDAISMLHVAFDDNEDVPGLAMNLARVECMAGDETAARTTLKAALYYSPNLNDMRRMLGQMTACADRGRK